MFRKKAKRRQSDAELLREINETLWAFHIIARRLGRKLDDYLTRKTAQPK